LGAMTLPNQALPGAGGTIKPVKAFPG
jgi:hypothetical protein